MNDIHVVLGHENPASWQNKNFRFRVSGPNPISAGFRLGDLLLVPMVLRGNAGRHYSKTADFKYALPLALFCLVPLRLASCLHYVLTIQADMHSHAGALE